MRGLIVSMPSAINEVKKVLSNYSSFEVTTELGNDLSGYDIIGIVGTDRFIIMNLHRLNSWDGPILTVGFGISFLNSIDITSLDKAIPNIITGNYDTEEILRLAVDIKGKRLPNAVNEVAIFPAKSAITIEYSLYVNGEYVWHDVADGLIVSTPTGSTAYAMSAGGPLIHSRARVLEIVTVNSTNLARVPIIVPSDSTIEIRDLISRSRVEIIIDGSIRSYAGSEVRIMSGRPIKLIRIGNMSSSIGRYEKKLSLLSNMDLPPSAKFILKILEYEGQLTQKEIMEKTMLPSRTVRNALNILIRKGLIKRQVILRGNKEVAIYSLPSMSR
ncbi:winged helix-turn-helix transcriptional regulator [Vulcanisaeta souniana]|uniref:ATP-NAD/AcoX kinase n=1 Tax=Vulcanisaeta souniana JCM 11219 TaxID=1293586 RepID=A0A830EJY2_9CREN|nr:winged helix-turn-helix transcriptional regulator [Vulcanisaeta souniana]BDR93257.1 ATP-NAD/AcoX kinase [Vulcanisaeta souniana JCM 11219]GGI78804.1 ATP-NAD/AcoX kinase [Vulcanisaeta souniana JCM 11219]